MNFFFNRSLGRLPPGLIKLSPVTLKPDCLSTCILKHKKYFLDESLQSQNLAIGSCGMPSMKLIVFKLF